VPLRIDVDQACTKIFGESRDVQWEARSVRIWTDSHKEARHVAARTQALDKLVSVKRASTNMRPSSNFNDTITCGLNRGSRQQVASTILIPLEIYSAPLLLFMLIFYAWSLSLRVNGATNAYCRCILSHNCKNEHKREHL